MLERFLHRDTGGNGLIETLSARFQAPEPARPACYLGDNRILTMTNRGDRMYVDARDIAIIPSLICYGGWEESC